LIGAANREGALESDPSSGQADEGFWRGLDRRAPLGPKLIAPVIAVTVLGTVLLSVVMGLQIQRSSEDTYVGNAIATARAAAAFDTVIDNPDGLSARLKDLVSDEPSVTGLWIVILSEPGAPVIGSANREDVGKTDILSLSEIASARSGATVNDEVQRQGAHVLLTVVPITDDGHAVVVMTSHQQEDQEVAQTILWIALMGLAVIGLEIGFLTGVLELGVFRRVRRVNAVVSAFGQGGRRTHLEEGTRPPGRDALFNLAREVDLKLRDLDRRERAGAVMADLGLLSLQGASPSDLAARALALTLDAADLDRCLFVGVGGRTLSLDASDAMPERGGEAELPVWISALARSAAHARKPVVSGRLGAGSHFWAGQAEPVGAAAVFVPLPGLTKSTGVVVGLAHKGGHVSSGTVSLMEGVATALSDSVDRGEALKAQQESADKTKALATVSHEMRTPLNAMLGFNELVLSGKAGPLNEKQHDYLKQVDIASHHLLQLVNDYLDMTRAEARSLPLEIEVFPVGPEVDAVLHLLKQSAAEKHVSLHATVEDDANVRADRMKLRQVLVNLVTNAIRSTPARGHVRIEAAGGSNGVRISVIDTGAGVPEDRQHLVFVEFADLHPGERSDGTGLGLALSKRFVDAMGGFIRFTSSEGAGSIFDIWLPGENTPDTAEPATHADSSQFSVVPRAPGA
jgi:signal transduction histidine kinase